MSVRFVRMHGTLHERANLDQLKDIAPACFGDLESLLGELRVVLTARCVSGL